VEGTPCSSSRVHGELAVLRHLGTSACAARGSKRGRTALAELLRSIKGLDCVRLLLEIRTVLHSNRSSLAASYEQFGFWQAYGLLLGEVLSRTPAGPIQESVWAELSDWLREAPGWTQRQEAVRTLAHMLPTVQVNAAHLSRFWNTFSAYTEFHRAAYLNPGERSEPFLAAARMYNELFYGTVFHMGETLSEGNIWELARAGRLTLDLTVIAEDDVSKWSTAVARLCTSIDERPYRSEPVQQQLWDISSGLDGYSRQELRAARRLQYKQALEALMPMLRNGARGGPRKQMLPEDRRCRVAIGGQVPVELEGVVRNVCCTTGRGFAVEIRQLSLESTAAINENPQCPGGGSPFKRLRLACRHGYDPGTPVSLVDEVELTLAYSEAGTRALTFGCSIVRAWTLISGDGTGLALFAPLQPEDLPDEWRAYIKQSTYLGRYDSIT
jgi:hypothetical protein